MNQGILIQAIIVLGGVSSTLLTLYFKEKRSKRKTDKNTMETRLDRIFNGYENLIRQLEEDTQRKQATIDELLKEISQLREELSENEKFIEELKEDLKRLRAEVDGGGEVESNEAEA